MLRAACYDEGTSITGQLYGDVRTEWETDRGVKESLLISEDSMLPPHNKVAPSILLAEVEGPPWWPIASVAGSGPTYKRVLSLMGF